MNGRSTLLTSLLSNETNRVTTKECVRQNTKVVKTGQLGHIRLNFYRSEDAPVNMPLTLIVQL